MSTITLNWNLIDPIIQNALAEDVGDGDITTNAIIDETAQASAFLQSKGDGVIAGLAIAERVFRHLDPHLTWQPLLQDGQRIKVGQTIAAFNGKTRALLTGERLALNILQHLSGIASQTAEFVAALEGLPTKILDTRKTLPGLRVLQKYAVAVGGGTNHRFGLYDGIMIKDNHIKLAGGIAQAVSLVRKHNPAQLPIEVETSNLEEVQQALDAGADIIMLDNMDIPTMKKAVRLINGRAKTEASGGVQLGSVRAIAETGVDFISVGYLTHSVTALDISMYFR
jgi:nicotinate-nucleotide pyrophosphorylase (carboxylating)